jgi:hypothetical protein
MDENITVVFHGFLNLSAKEKLKLVEAINEYFDATEREPLRAVWEEKFREVNFEKNKCKCCGK